MARKRRHEEHENLERWLISYADFVTLLFAFFVVMYSISSINEGKYRVLSDTLLAAFHTPPKTLQPIQVGTEGISGDPSALKDKDRRGKPNPVQMIRPGPANTPLRQIADEFRQALSPLIDKKLINIHRDDLWVEVEINNSILFPSGSAQLEEAALPVLQKLADILGKYPNHIQVEGFTDNLPISTIAFPSNWELSAARAASVVHVFMRQGVQGERMAAIGYGQYRPVASNATPEGRNKNRRVAVVILADADARRVLDIKRNAKSDAAAAQVVQDAESGTPAARTAQAPAGGEVQ
jgi:chemotaxis protein MotB